MKKKGMNSIRSGKGDKYGEGDGQIKRKVVRGMFEKHCVACLSHSLETDPLDENEYLRWGRPWFAEGVEGSICFHCRRLHRAKASLKYCAACIL